MLYIRPDRRRLHLSGCFYRSTTWVRCAHRPLRLKTPDARHQICFYFMII